MKKILLTLLLAVTFTATYAQNKYQERQNKYFVEAAAKEYNLDQAQQDDLTNTRTTMVLAFKDIADKVKSESITKDEAKAQRQEASKAFNNAIIKLTGKNYKELNPFLKRMREELKTVK